MKENDILKRLIELNSECMSKLLAAGSFNFRFSLLV